MHPFSTIYTSTIYQLIICHTRFSKENRMHLIRVPESQIHTYDIQMSVISQYNAQNVQREVY
jgi:hypothetical protein